MKKITIIGIDIAKNVFQVHAVGSDGTVVLRRQLRRGQVLGFFAKLDPCLIGLEACATSHYWAREFQGLGHDVRLIPPIYVKPYVKRQKNDAADAEAICEAVQRPTMRFVAVKSAEQQGVLMLHRARELLVGQRNRGRECHPVGPFAVGQKSNLVIASEAIPDIAADIVSGGNR